MRRKALVVVSLLAFLFSNVHGQGEEEFLEPCEGFPQSPVYCYGDLLHTIQINHLYEDDKTFVDFALKHHPNQIVANFDALNITGDVGNDTEKKQQLETFVSQNFENGTEFENWDPSDWIPNPSFLDGISDPNYKIWAQTLHGFWDELGRKIKQEVKNNSEKYSMQYVPHPVIVPGGRFKEFYYWDSYWIQKGLLISEMKETVRGMIENFIEMVKGQGFIPNGGRIYYQRSQPPLFIPMVKNYVEATGNWTFVEDNIQWLEQEFDFFIKNRTITFPKGGRSYTMARYNVNRKGPRPESYSKDYEVVAPLGLNETEEAEIYANLKAGAESGWDFSSRWFVNEDNGTEDKLHHTKTRDIIPVDLNGFLYWNAVILNEFCNRIPRCTQAPTYYAQKAFEWKLAIKEVLWNEELGSWFDYDFVRGLQRTEFYATTLVPLWVKAHHDATTASRVVNYLKISGAASEPAGIPSSLLQTGEQWDYPNGWAPLNHMVVEALEYSGNQEARELAQEIAEKWTATNYKAYYTHNNTMFEKYDVTCLGCAGGGGEYEVVVGFGWTNGVILEFLKMYGDRIEPPEIDERPYKPDKPSTGVRTAVHTSVWAMLVIKAIDSMMK